MHREYDAVDVRPARRWLTSAREGLAVREGATVEAHHAYVDTPDWRFHRAGLTLRVTTRGSVSEAVCGPRNGKLVVARSPIARARTDSLAGCSGLVGERVRALATTGPLEVLFEMRSRRQSFDLEAGGAHVARLTLDETTVPLPGSEPPARLSRVEVSYGSPNAETERLLRLIELACGLRPARSSKYDTVLLTAGLAPPPGPEIGPAEIDRSATAPAVARAVLRRQLRKMLDHEGGTRLGEDIEELHDMRVASRRIRAALRLFGERLPALTLKLRAEFGWLGRTLGEVRDLDVHLEQLDAWSTELDPEDRAALETVAERLRAQRVVARRRMIRVLDSRRYERLLGRALRQFREPRRPPAGARSILDVAPDLIRTRYGKVIRAGKRLSADSPAADFHRLRIRCKALRYALEFHRDVYGRALEPVIAPLVRLQDLLGEHQDADVASAWLRDLVRERRGIGAQTVFVAGMLAERYSSAANKLRGRFSRRFKRLSGKRRRRLLAHLDGLRHPQSAC